MKLLYISHQPGDCFVEPDKDLEVIARVDQRSLKEIFEDQEYPRENIDLIFCHPKETGDPGWRLAFQKAIFFSGGYSGIIVRPETKSRAAHIPKELLQQYWRVLVDEFFTSKDIEKAVATIACPAKTNVGNTINFPIDSALSLQKLPSRHQNANIIGPRILLETARQVANESNSAEKESRDFIIPVPDDGELEKIIAVLDKVETGRGRYDLNAIPLPLTPFNKSLGMMPKNRILLIDDEHRRGWSTAFAMLLSGDCKMFYNVNSLETLPGEAGIFAMSSVGVPEQPGDMSTFILKITKHNHSQILPFDLLLLDYRAKNEDLDVPPEQVSGTQIIKLIKKIDPSLPIIVVTASENYKTFRQLSLYGILGYYVKPNDLRAEENRRDYLNLCSMLAHSQVNKHWRDLWRIILWLREKRPTMNEIFLSGNFFSADKKAQRKRSPKAKSRALITFLNRGLVNWAAFVYRQSQVLMFAQSIVKDDPEISRSHSIDVYLWSIFRLSVISDAYYQNSRKAFEGKLKEKNSPWAAMAQVCKYIRNLTMHYGDAFEPTEADFFIMVICLVSVLFEDEIEDSDISTLCHKFNTTKLPDFEFLLNAVEMQWSQDANNDVRLQRNDDESSEEYLLRVLELEKHLTRKPMLQAAYLRVFKELSNLTRNQRGFDKQWPKLLMALIAQALSPPK